MHLARCTLYSLLACRRPRSSADLDQSPDEKPSSSRELSTQRSWQQFAGCKALRHIPNLFIYRKSAHKPLNMSGKMRTI